MIEYFETIDYDKLIQNLSGIGGFITSLITLFTLIVLIRQRKDSFRPRIIFGDRLYASCRIEENNILKTKWDESYPDKNEEVIDFCFQLLNVGVGVAENVVVKERFDYKKAIKFIKELDRENEFKIIKIGDTLEFETTFDKSFMFAYVTITPRELGTFLTGKQDKPQKYLFTDTCLMFLSCFDYLRNKYDRFMNLDKFPRCHYELQYSDVEGKRYKANYECKVSSIFSDNYTFEFIKK